MDNFYVYEWIRLDTNEPFYVGKGHGGRAYDPYNNRNRYFNNIVKKLGVGNVVVSILHDELDEQTSLEYEVYYISLYKDEFGFKLSNITDGGEGVAGLKHSSETKRSLRERFLGKKMSEEHKRKLSENNSRYWTGKHRDEETRKKISESLKGNMASQEARDKMKEKKQWRYSIIIPNQEPIIISSSREVSKFLGISTSIVQKLTSSQKQWNPTYKKHYHLKGLKILKVS